MKYLLFFATMLMLLISCSRVSGQTGFVTTQYVETWGMDRMHPTQLRPTTFLFRNDGTAMNGSPFYSLYAGSHDSINFASGGDASFGGFLGSKAYPIHDQLKAWAKSNSVNLMSSGLFSETGAFYANISDTSTGGKGDQMRDAWIGFAVRNGMRGIDIDWEYAHNADSTRKKMAVWLRRTRAVLDALNPKGFILVTVPQWFAWNANIATPLYNREAISYVDYWQVMAYNINASGNFSANQPLHPYPGEPSGSKGWEWDNARTLREMVACGVPFNRIIFLSSGEIKQYAAIGGSIAIGSPATAISDPASGGNYHTITQYPANYFTDPKYKFWNDAGKFNYFTDQTSWGLSAETYQSLKAHGEWICAQVDPSGNHLAGHGIYDDGRLFDQRLAIPDSPMIGFIEGMRGTISPVDTTPNPPPPAIFSAAVTSFGLVNSLTYKPVAGYYPLINGAVIDKKAIVAPFTIQAIVSGSPGSVLFTSPANHNENIAPYSFPDDNGASGQGVAWNPAPGSYQITAIPYSGSGATGTKGTILSIAVTVVDSTIVIPPPVITCPNSDSIFMAGQKSIDTQAIGQRAIANYKKQIPRSIALHIGSRDTLIRITIPPIDTVLGVQIP